MLLFAGVDPGLSGAVCLMDAEQPGQCWVGDIPTLTLKRGGKDKREIDAHAFCNLVEWGSVSHCFLEQVASMPKQGVSSMFAMGKAYGMIIGTLAARGVPMTLVAPRKWKTALGVPADKDGARARASQLLPNAAHHWPLKKHHNRCEAALICLFGARESAPK